MLSDFLHFEKSKLFLHKEISHTKTGDEELKFHIWDTEWHEDISGMNLYFRGWHGVVLVYDVTKQETFNNLGSWIEIIKENLPNAKLILVGNKSDLQNLKTVSPEDGQALAESEGINFYETSALDWNNINEAFDNLLGIVIDANIRNDD